MTDVWPPPPADVGATLCMLRVGRWAWSGRIVWDMNDGQSFHAPAVFSAWTRDGLRRKMLRWVEAHRLSTDVVVWRET